MFATFYHSDQKSPATRREKPAQEWTKKQLLREIEVLQQRLATLEGRTFPRRRMSRWI